MANEISLSTTLTCTNVNYSDSFRKTISINQATADGTKPTFLCTTSDTALTLTPIGTFGLCVFYNQDITNYVDIGPDHSGAIDPFVRVMPGEFATLRLKPGITVRTQAHTASVLLSVWLLEN